MHSKDKIARRVVKLLELGKRPGTEAEGIAARKAAAELTAEYGLTDDDLRLARELDGLLEQPDRAAEHDRARRDRERHGKQDQARGDRPVATDYVLEQHRIHPERVHLAYDDLSSVCGVRPTFVWCKLRDELLGFDEPCPYCLASGVIDTRQARKRLGPAW
jgi:hypothetical protein